MAEAFLTRTAPPWGAETFLAVAVAHGEHTEEYHRLYTTLTGGSDDPDWTANSTIAARAEAAAPRQVLMLALALLVCEWESTTSRTTWRHPGERDRRYLTALIGWGYQPSDVEHLVLADTTTTADTDADSDEAGPLEEGTPRGHRVGRRGPRRGRHRGRVRRRGGGRCVTSAAAPIMSRHTSSSARSSNSPRGSVSRNAPLAPMRGDPEPRHQ